jgi:hypothetical protein
MPKSDKVPCWYRDQDSSWELPAFIYTRAEARDKKNQLLGKFENHGQTFRLEKTIKDVLAVYWDGPFGIGNLLPFSRTQNKLMAPEHLHYQIPACGAHSRRTSVFLTNLPLPLPLSAEAYS